MWLMIHNLRVRSYSKNGYHGKPWCVFIYKITPRNRLRQNVWHVWVAEQLQIFQLVDGLGGVLFSNKAQTSQLLYHLGASFFTHYDVSQKCY